MIDEVRSRLEALFAACEWTFAKTMPHNPHHYTLRAKWANDDDFVWAVRAIREYGVIEKYRGRLYTVLYLGERGYWTMGAPITPAPYDPKTDTSLINRKAIGKPTE